VAMLKAGLSLEVDNTTVCKINGLNDGSTVVATIGNYDVSVGAQSVTVTNDSERQVNVTLKL